jgi:dTDP-4-dehydrorhamnose 3,5-epimerase
MNQQLSLTDITQEQRDKISSQQYQKPTIEGVKIFHLKEHVTEDGSFTEIIRIQDDGSLSLVPEMKIAQINRSVMLPGSVKAWHLHFNQDEIWNVGFSTHLILGLWDIREQSPTKHTSMKIALTANTHVFITRGVAHGAANISVKNEEILYFVSNQYNKEQPDEHRLPWDSLGKEFWEAKKE